MISCSCFGIIPARAGFTSLASRRPAGASDHPRSRGVYLSPASGRRLARGSSPLARGLRPPPQDLRLGGRIIPARAGFTRAPVRLDRRRGDHPRSRGVYISCGATAWAARGSSPLARGLQSADGSAPAGLGIIPARAGFTHDPVGALRGGGGSSPLARGLQRPHARPAPRQGIIPARAGFTLPRPGVSRETWDHPRSRGVYSSTPQACPARPGSSPLARGLPRRRHRRWRVRRIIPARAGFTPPPTGNRERTQDHPRSRGVYTWPTRRPRSPWGSSPLARGLPSSGRARDDGHRIIPARAGFTRARRRPRRARRDHPRSRGVYGGGSSPTAPADGSSPLARGLQPVPAAEPAPAGIIPARAGFTPARFRRDG